MSGLRSIGATVAKSGRTHLFEVPDNRSDNSIFVPSDRFFTHREEAYERSILCTAN